ncbi:aflatoxin B1-aldehyde reductase [Mycena amicta]|nr:aflatoxin B1-aldehyde reductase [Mycena amicta]
MPASTFPAHSTFTPRIPVIYGASSIGAPGTFCTLTSAPKAQRVIDAWCEAVGQIASTSSSHSAHNAVDTSNVYGFGTSEKILAQTDLHGCAVDTKFYPLLPGDHSRAKLREACDRMLTALDGKRVRVLYLNAPDHATPFAETFSTMNELYKEGKFEILGLSNYRSFEVAQIATMCRANGWVVPRVYQGVYSAVDRSVETELLPCLRQFNIKFSAYCPLAGGYLVGGMLFDPASASDMDGVVNPRNRATSNSNSNSHRYPPLREIQRRLRGSGGHFDPHNPFGMWYHNRYLHSRMNTAVLSLCAVLRSYNLTLHEASVRWLQHHSALVPSDLGIVFGGSRPEHVTTTLGYCMHGPLPDAVVDAFDVCDAQVRGGLPGYWYDPACNRPWYASGASPQGYGAR